MHRKRNLVLYTVIFLFLFSGCSVTGKNTDEKYKESVLYNTAGKENEVSEQYNADVSQDPTGATDAGDAADETVSAPESVTVSAPGQDSDSSVLSPEPGKYTISQKAQTIYTDRAAVYIEANIFYPENFGDIVEYTLDLIEQETGLKFSPDKKLLIHVQHENTPRGSENGIKIQPEDVLSSNIAVMFHELSHTIQLQTCGYLGVSSITEGFAVMNTMKMIKKSKLPALHDVFFNESYLENESQMLADPETFIMNVQGDDAYSAGFRFVYYLEEKYGSDIMTKIFRKIGELYPYGGYSTDNLSGIIKNQTSENVFQDFAEWYERNREMFIRSNPLVSLENADYVEIFPIYNEYEKSYIIPAFTYRDSITLDFANGFAYLQQLGINNIKGIYAFVESEGKHTLSFYNAADELIHTEQIDNSADRTDIDGAVKIIITGDGSPIKIYPNLELMIEN